MMLMVIGGLTGLVLMMVCVIGIAAYYFFWKNWVKILDPKGLRKEMDKKRGENEYAPVNQNENNNNGF
jgi:hypothetical protein